MGQTMHENSCWSCAWDMFQKLKLNSRENRERRKGRRTGSGDWLEILIRDIRTTEIKNKDPLNDEYIIREPRMPGQGGLKRN